MCLGFILNAGLVPAPALPQHKWRQSPARAPKRASEGLFPGCSYLHGSLPWLLHRATGLPG